MDIKLVALDLDGTLLNESKEISPRNLNALKMCTDKGIYIVPSTGRTVEGIPELIKNLPGIQYAITLNGGSVVDMKSKKVISESKLNNQVTREILDLVSEYNLMYDVYIEGKGISEERFYNHLEAYNIPAGIQKLVKATRRVVPSIKGRVKEYGAPIEKINLYFASQEDREMLRTILGKRDDIIVTSSVENNLEINALGATKGEGLLHLSQHLNIPIEATMACGDGENDVTMIETAGVGVVMENGAQVLKEVADYITASNDNDGVALAIERFALS